MRPDIEVVSRVVHHAAGLHDEHIAQQRIDIKARKRLLGKLRIVLFADHVDIRRKRIKAALHLRRIKQLEARLRRGRVRQNRPVLRHLHARYAVEAVAEDGLVAFLAHLVADVVGLKHQVHALVAAAHKHLNILARQAAKALLRIKGHANQIPAEPVAHHCAVDGDGQKQQLLRIGKPGDAAQHLAAVAAAGEFHPIAALRLPGEAAVAAQVHARRRGKRLLAKGAHHKLRLRIQVCNHILRGDLHHGQSGEHDIKV